MANLNDIYRLELDTPILPTIALGGGVPKQLEDRVKPSHYEYPERPHIVLDLLIARPTEMPARNPLLYEETHRIAKLLNSINAEPYDHYRPGDAFLHGTMLAQSLLVVHYGQPRLIPEVSKGMCELLDLNMPEDEANTQSWFENIIPLSEHETERDSELKEVLDKYETYYTDQQLRRYFRLGAGYVKYMVAMAHEYNQRILGSFAEEDLDKKYSGDWSAMVNQCIRQLMDNETIDGTIKSHLDPEIDT